ncbi:hypothetical protein SVIOM342S_00831 [Streptomyces violaceorubidus]
MTTTARFDPRALLAGSRLGVLATIKSDGRPQLSPVMPAYDPDAGVIRVSTRDGLAKTANLRRDPRATLEVTAADGRSWATAEGVATLTGPGTTRTDRRSRRWSSTTAPRPGNTRTGTSTGRRWCPTAGCCSPSRSSACTAPTSAEKVQERARPAPQVLCRSGEGSARRSRTSWRTRTSTRVHACASLRVSPGGTMRLSRSRIGVVVLFGAMTLTLTALAFPAVLGLDKADGNQNRVVASTKFGPLTEADRDFVVKVRAAGLWEYPLGEMVMKRGTTKAMKTAGEHLVVGHAGLDAMCREISPELGITLPNRASPQQEGFVATVDAKTGKEFDSSAVNIMRVTHGQIPGHRQDPGLHQEHPRAAAGGPGQRHRARPHHGAGEHRAGRVRPGHLPADRPAKLPRERVTPPAAAG